MYLSLGLGLVTEEDFREHPAVQNLKFLNFFLLLRVIFALLDPDPLTRFNLDPIRIRMRNPAGYYPPCITSKTLQYTWYSLKNVERKQRKVSDASTDMV